MIETAALGLAPHPLPYYAMELATVFNAFYDTDECRVWVTGSTRRSVARA